MVIEKNVISRKTKKRMTIYDKAKEMDKAKNRSFVEVYQLEHAFDNTSRFELNLNSQSDTRICRKGNRAIPHDDVSDGQR